MTLPDRVQIKAEAYGKFAEEPTKPELERFFFLDDVDRDLIALRRTQHHQLGFALQMCTVRYVGLFLGEDPLDVPWPVVEHLAEQLGIEDASCVKRYTDRRQTVYDHAWEIREAYGYQLYEDRAQGRKFRSFLHGRAWTAHAEGPKALFDHSVGWLRRNRVLLPGVSVLAREVAEVRRLAEERLHATVAKEVRRVDAALPGDLVATLKTPEGKRYSELERMRRPPTRTTGTAMKGALQRVEDIASFQLGRVKLDKIPPNRLSALARYGLGTKAPKLERTPEPKRTAMLTAVMRYLEAKAIDDALDLFEILMATRLISTAKRSSEKQRLSTLPQLESASRLVARAAAVFIEELELIEQTGCDVDVSALWRALEEVAPRAALSSAATVVVSLVPEDDNTAETALRSALALRYNTVKPFLSLLGESKAMDAAPGGRRILTGVQRLPALSRRKVVEKPLLPREVDDKLVPSHWRKAVYANADLPEGAVDRDAYVVCVLEQLFGALKRRDIFASPSHRWSDPRARLLQGKGWEAVREDVLAGLSLDEDAEQHLRELVDVLDATWKQMAERLEEAGDDAKISIEVQPNGRAKLNVEKLHALGEPKSLKWLRERVEKMLPKIDLPDLLFEVHAWTGFLDAFVHLGDGKTRMKDLPTSMVALLVSEACNIGMTPVINPGYEALTRSRLVHVDQYYLRADTIAAANAALIAAQAWVPIVQFWGKGLLASVDGLRFVVPTRSINAAPSPKYFAKKKGITWLNAINDQVIGIGQMVVPGTPRDSLFILDALLNLDGGVKPEMVATDNASYSDMVFGIFKMLGYRFSPRFKDLEDQRFWKAQMPGAENAGGYGPLEAIARNKVNVKKVITHWPDMLRVAGSLVTNQVRAYDLLRMFGREGHPAPLGQAFAEYGRIAKTLHLLAVVDPMDDTYRRQMHKQLTVQESRHNLARNICHGKKGTIHQAYRDGMEDQLGSLGLVLNAVVLWTTRYIDAAVAQLRAEGHEIRDEDVARLSPLKHRNLNVLGRYSFTASVPRDGLRPLRDPDAVDLDDDDDGNDE
ncbi:MULTISPECIES: Tn3 family transposase [unclassified Streptomyces]|uniref:Tn3 family transposase n=1 Tax=unclassified Streptomyces TaxID=2593676 RepID=UPI002023F3ED|nr:MULTISPECIES: Tn3 family transposase [unclassified Streptomyces]MCX4548221.1 Tn3 family transposase [Streptomyces sp. NBC_01500]